MCKARVNRYFASVLVMLLTLFVLSCGYAADILKKGAVTVRYNVKVPMPLSLSKKSNAQFLQVLRSRLEDHVAHGLGEVAGLEFEMPSSIPPLMTVTATYQLFASRYVIGARYILLSYVSQAAHPVSDIVTVNFNLKTHQLLRLNQLLLASSLSDMSRFCRSALEKRGVSLASSWQGTKPIWSNFKHWNITPKGLLISFTDGQVGPHAIGLQTVLVPRKLIARYMLSRTKDLFAPFANKVAQ